ncbi:MULTISPECIES: TRAP transporter large permease [Alphaproteobacteria]|uniref:TRAP transporter large permease protein n=2 Tax=Alphaproteobacteria TaxID=28211 RepID=A0A512HNN8_9HYPH|nr:MULTISPECIES: TRAP transporter large permease [Alphaproteobacteria]GEO87062.1 C4-dicarboxylate ABC transporter permease [Ciceribacter naphthalenivorans]GLR23152.1 C4-dicarboxylate ABC transporter permease [Ciceribacter naphthalenivorans]GLT06008.1 C4-dicarboxylate ABC transporter permease [Sphingomonas psychrolutea]
MSVQVIGQVGMLALIFFVFIRIPVAVAMGLVGFGGYSLINGVDRALQVAGQVPYDIATNYTLSQLPLFVLMGDLAVRSGMSGRLYSTAQDIFAGLRGAHAYATLGASAGFGAVSGSSVATAATMTRVAVPSMQEAKYDDRLSAGCIAAGGTLGILIPPSIALVIFAMIAEESVPRLYAASLVPGILLCFLYIFIVAIIVWIAPHWAPQTSDRPRFRDRIRSLGQVWEIVVLFAMVMGGLYTGLFTATEAAAVGAFGAWLLGTVTGRLTVADTKEAIFATIRTSAVLFAILYASNIFAYFVVLAQLPQGLVSWVNSMDLSPIALMLLISGFYIILGCFLEAFGMILITVPILLPLIQQAGFDPVWYGVFIAIMIEVSMITPPVGMNIFVMQGQMPGISLPRLYQSVMPFVIAPILLTVMIILVPEIATWLPAVLFD